MSLVKWTFIGVIVLPVAEFATFLLVVMAIGWVWAVFLFVATSVLGVFVLKHAGRADLERFRAALSRQGVRALRFDAPGLARIVGGILLVLPGFITDLLGALLLVPPLRRGADVMVRRALRKRRAARDPATIDLAPGEWHQIPDVVEDAHRHERRRRASKS